MVSHFLDVVRLTRYLQQLDRCLRAYGRRKQSVNARWLARGVNGASGDEARS